jgi:hypothetical protein
MVLTHLVEGVNSNRFECQGGTWLHIKDPFKVHASIGYLYPLGTTFGVDI